MNLLVTTEQRFTRLGSGAIVTSGPLGHGFWERYLDVFDEVRVVSRVQDGSVAADEGQAVTGPGVSVLELPAYVGPSGYLWSLPQLSRVLGRAAGTGAAVIVRAPSPLGTRLLAHVTEPHRRAFGLEVVGDPLDVFAAGAVRHPLRVLFRWWFARQLRRQCRRAAAVAYVSRRSLQARYPVPVGPESPFVTSYSSIELSPADLAARPRIYESTRPPFRLVTVGSLEQTYKGVDVLLRAVALCVARGVPVTLEVIGDGRERGNLEAQARSLALGDRVTFRGQLPGPRDVVPHLETAHLFVLAARTEGLPRAMIEAMARAVPCIGSDVGGIPELLDAEDRVPAGNAEALADALAGALGDAARLAAMSARHLERAREYTTEVLRPRRRAFFQAVEAAAAAARETRV